MNFPQMSPVHKNDVLNVDLANAFVARDVFNGVVAND